MMFTDWQWDWPWSKTFEINVIETMSIMVMMLLMMIPHWSSKAYDDPGLLSELGHHRHMLLIWVPWGGRKPDQTISHLRSCLLDLSWFEQLIQQELKRAVSTSCGWKWGAPRGGGALNFFCIGKNAKLEWKSWHCQNWLNSPFSILALLWGLCDS